MNNYKFGLVGFPVSHSFSPIIHQAALDSFGLKGSYQLFPIEPFPDGQQKLKNLLSEIKNKKIVGINITVPHKQNLLSLVDQLSPTAVAIGAVNTVHLIGNSLVGDNTDAQGFYTSLKASNLINPNRPKVALVLGAGGSARAVIYALANEGWKLYVASRRIEQAQELISSINPHLPKNNLMSAIQFSIIENLKEECQILINTTPVGMHPIINENPWPANLEYPSHLNLFDLIYNPKKTQLSILAENSGARTTNGLGMLIEQAALSFELWTGKSPDRKILTQAVHTIL